MNQFSCVASVWLAAESGLTGRPISSPGQSGSGPTTRAVAAVRSASRGARKDS